MYKTILSSLLILLAVAILIFYGAYAMALLAMMTGAVPLIGQRVTGADNARIPNMIIFVRSSPTAVTITVIAIVLAIAMTVGLVAAGGWRLVPEVLTGALVIGLGWAWAMKYVFMEELRN